MRCENLTELVRDRNRGSYCSRCTGSEDIRGGRGLIRGLYTQWNLLGLLLKCFVVIILKHLDFLCLINKTDNICKFTIPYLLHMRTHTNKILILVAGVSYTIV
jgi:hypothetical protein